MTDLRPLKAGAAAVDPPDFNTLIDEMNGGGGGGTITEVTSNDESVTVTNGTGPIIDLSVSGGGGSQGVPIVRGPFSFAFDDAGLSDGIVFYTPTIGDFLLNAWVVVDTAWDGDTPRIDIGTGIGTVYGLWDTNSGVNAALADISAGNDVHGGGDGILYNPVFAAFSPALAVATGAARIVPALFTAANPLKVWVSQDAAIGGLPPGAAQGAARLYIVTATPVAL